MKKTVGIITGIIVVLLLIVLSNSVYIVKEDEVAVVKSLSKITAVVVAQTDVEKLEGNLLLNGDLDIKIISEKGLHFKIPFVDSVTKYTSKYLTYLSPEKLINTKDGRLVEIQIYAQYRIADPIIFMNKIGNASAANSRMNEIVIKTVINEANTMEFNEFFFQTTLEDKLQSRQADLNDSLLTEYGIYVSDIGINNKSFPDSNISNIEEKMAKEIEKDSEKLIAEGDAIYVEEAAKTDRMKSETIATAVEEAAIIMADADAQALRIYQEALQKDLEFYQFTQRMKIYKELEGVTIFLNADNDIFDYIDGYSDVGSNNNVDQSEADNETNDETINE